MNYNFSLRQVLGFIGVMCILGVVTSFLVPPMVVFHITNPLAIALGVVLIWVYGRGITDAFRNRTETVTPAHLLTFGVVLNWIGMTVRMGRWYFTGEHPSVQDNVDFWIYNFGLWVSIWAGLFLLGASKLSVPNVKPGTLLVVFFTIFGFLMWLGIGMAHMPGGLLGPHHP